MKVKDGRPRQGKSPLQLTKLNCNDSRFIRVYRVIENGNAGHRNSVKMPD